MALREDPNLALTVAAMAAGATLLGTVLGGALTWLVQGRLAERQREWTVADQEATRRHEQELRAAEVREARFQLLRSERREVYARYLDAANEFTEALQDLRDTKLPDETVRTTDDLEREIPGSARALRAQSAHARVIEDLVLIADGAVWDAVFELASRFSTAFRMAARHQDGLGPVFEQRSKVLGAMRHELIVVDSGKQQAPAS